MGRPRQIPHNQQFALQCQTLQCARYPEESVQSLYYQYAFMPMLRNSYDATTAATTLRELTTIIGYSVQRKICIMFLTLDNVTYEYKFLKN